MEQSPPPWVPPEVAGRDAAGRNAAMSDAAGAPGGRYRTSTPLGGRASPEPEPARSSQARDLVVAAALLVAAVLTALGSLMSWRDYGRGLDPDENGWQLADGSLGRGWVAVLVAVALAVGGVLLVTGRRRAGRVWARVGSGALIVLPVLEWAFGEGDRRTGPGNGLWVFLVTGMVLMVLLGSVLPSEDDEPAGK